MRLMSSDCVAGVCSVVYVGRGQPVRGAVQASNIAVDLNNVRREKPFRYNSCLIGFLYYWMVVVVVVPVPVALVHFAISIRFDYK